MTRRMTVATDLGHIAFSPGGEEWIEYGPAHDRRRVGFHDYAALYSVPGLYERVFHDELEMCSADVVVGLYADTLAQLDRDPAHERVLDLGAGSGLGGALLRDDVGVAAVVGLDLEPAARIAAEREHPGVYEDFLVADLSASPTSLDALAEKGFTALVAVSAIGVGHIPLELLADTIRRVLPAGGLFAFAVATELPGFLDELFDLVEADRLASREYVHRRQTDGTPHEAVAVAAQLR